MATLDRPGRPGLWGRACLRSHDDIVAIAALWAAIVVGAVLVVAGLQSWPVALVIGPLLAAATYLPYRVRRRRWDAVVGRAADDGLVRLERLLDEHRRPPDKPT